MFLSSASVVLVSVTDMLLLGKGPRLSNNLIECLCLLRRFHWLQGTLVDPGFCFSQLLFQLIERNRFSLCLPLVDLCLFLFLNVSPIPFVCCYNRFRL
jgi:hypothetical protein